MPLIYLVQQIFFPHFLGTIQVSLPALPDLFFCLTGNDLFA
jgi:hypothetical protein